MEVYVQLLGEGTRVFRPTTAAPVRAGVVRLLPTEHYNPNDENWEFKPGSIVRIEQQVLSGPETVWVAVSYVG
jgi:hypothetical protein